MSVVHRHQTFSKSVCGKTLGDDVKSVDWRMVSCRNCCVASSNPYAANRLAELDRATAQGGAWVDSTGVFRVEAYRAWLKRVQEKPIIVDTDNSAKVAYVNDVAPDKRIVDVSLLTRLSDFIASIPGAALDRNSNALAMTLRRETANVVCPDKGGREGGK